MAVRLKKIYIRNFQTVKEAEIDFPTSGLCLVVGKNLSCPGVDSIGSGKTTLGEAISRTLLGVRGKYDGLGLGAYSSDHNSNRDTLIRLSCEVDGKPLEIMSGFKCKEMSSTGEALRYFINGEEIERGKISETRDDLNSMLGISTHLAEYTVHVDGERLKFNKLSERELIDLFTTASSRTNWDKAQKKVKETLASVKSDMASTNGKLQQISDQIISLEARISRLREDEDKMVSDYQKKVDDQSRIVESIRKSIADNDDKSKKISQSKKDIKKKLKSLEETKAEEYARLELESSRLRSDISSKSKKLDELVRTGSSLEKDLQRAKSNLSKLRDSKSCPECKRAFDNYPAEKDSEYSSLVDSIMSRLSEHQLMSKPFKKELDNLEDELESVAGKIRRSSADTQTKELSKEYENAEEAEKKLVKEKIRLERSLVESESDVPKPELDRVRADIRAALSSLKEAKSSKEESESSLSESTKIKAVCEYWEKAFGPFGLPNFIINESIGYVNHLSSQTSAILTGGLLDISYTTTKILADDTHKPELTITVNNKAGAKRFSGSSKGESGISNLVISETLYDFGRMSKMCGYRWMDEAVNSQDSMVRGSVYGYMKKQANDNSLLTFVVDHNQDVESFADHLLLAEKSPAGFTTYRYV